MACSVHSCSAKQEKEVKASLSPRIAEVLKEKRLCLLETLLTEAGHEDLGLVDDIKKGFDFTGALPRSGVFIQKFRPASMTCGDLRKVSNLSRIVSSWSRCRALETERLMLVSLRPLRRR